MIRLVASSIPRMPVDHCAFDLARQAQQHHAEGECCALIYLHDFRAVHVVEGPEDSVRDYAVALERDPRLLHDWTETAPIEERTLDPAMEVGLLDWRDLPVEAADRPADDSAEVLESLLVAAQVKFPSAIDASSAVESPLEETSGHEVTGRLSDPT